MFSHGRRVRLTSSSNGPRDLGTHAESVCQLDEPTPRRDNARLHARLSAIADEGENRENVVRSLGWAMGVACLISSSASAQQSEWAKLPRMQLERQFAGPLQDTVIQRWRDPVDGTICYVYLPFSAPHSPPTASGYVQYGSATIGSLSCMAAPARAPAAAPRAVPKSETSGAPKAPAPQ